MIDVSDEEAPPNPLTVDEQKAAIAVALAPLADRRPANRGELGWYVETFYGYRVPGTAVCDGHCSPLDAFAAAFFDECLNAIWVGPRTGGKTLQFAMLDHMAMRFDADTIANVGAVDAQAKKCYSYFTKFCDLPHFKKDVKRSIMAKTEFRNGGELEVLPATMNRLNSPHTRRLHLDEAELMTQQLYDEAKSIPTRINDRPPSKIVTSTRKFRYGLMEDIIKGAHDAGATIYKWCVFEIIEQCPETRHKQGAGCETCPLMEICKEKEFGLDGIERFKAGPGRAARARGWMAIDDVIGKFKDITREVFDAQWLSLRPESTGLVYPQFDDDRHVIDYEISPLYPIACGIDFGFINPSAQIAIQLLPNDDLVICDEIYATRMMDDEFAVRIREKPWFRKDQARVCDPAYPQSIKTLNDHGVPCTGADKSQKKGESSVMNGIQMVRWLLKPPRPTPLLYISRSCRNTIDEIGAYHTPDTKDDRNPEETPKKSGDHAMDGMRYIVYHLFRGSIIVN
jgi:hypothetical protein